MSSDIDSRGLNAGSRSLAKEFIGMFGIDTRSLAVFRIGLGLLLLSDLLVRSQYLTAHYTDLGILPRAARIALCEPAGDVSGLGFVWSFHMLSGEFWIQTALFCVAACVACSLLIGYRTRLSTCASWALLVSLHARNPMILQGGDVLLRCLLFWGMFLPLGARWSIDSHLRPPALDATRRPVLSVATVALLLQIVFVYLFCAALKLHPVWTKDYTAVYYALSIDQFTTPLGLQLLKFPSLLRTLTWGTFWFEWIGPVLAFVPFTNGRLRTLTVFAFWMFHISLGLAMELGPFSYICIVAWTAFLPCQFWDVIGRWMTTPSIQSGVSWADDLSQLSLGIRNEVASWFSVPAKATWSAVAAAPAGLLCTNNGLGHPSLVPSQAEFLGDTESEYAYDEQEYGTSDNSGTNWGYGGFSRPDSERDGGGTGTIAAPRQSVARHQTVWEPMDDESAQTTQSRHAVPVMSLSSLVFRNPETPRMHLGLVRGVVVGFLLVYVICWNLRETYPPESFWWRIMPVSVNPIGRVTALDQRWNMFSPYPLTSDGWYVMRGTLRDGTVVNLFRPGDDVKLDKPALVSATYPTERWRKYLMTINMSDNMEHRRYLSNWLRWRWDAHHAGKNPQRQVKTVEILFHCEVTPPPGQPRVAPEKMALWTWHYPS